MKGTPSYFEAIRLKAARRWDQLEQDPELAGPWHQLFKQVQSPRHILSELLQNADDAGATEASVRIEGQLFVFEHNGDDFTDEHFASLCRFGYSNKRALHTIGFRGIGFKSTFSLGDCVELFTPTLAVSFKRKRFTEPCWLSDKQRTEGTTRVCVGISDQHRQKEVEKNLEEWVESPLSLLFFKNIRRIQIGNHVVHWVISGPGPVPDSKWMVLHDKPDDPFLFLSSASEIFPEDALTEIKQERMLGIEEDAEFPPCKIDIVLRAKGRLYVVLPTGVETELPFACNAPFIQDPARLKIKDPETSPTNRWLLERAGKLAASAMLFWLGQIEMSLAERAAAYGLFPDVDRKRNSLEGVCGTIVEEAFAEILKGIPLLLANDGVLTCKNMSVIIPDEVYDVWPAEQAAALLDQGGRPPLCEHVGQTDRDKLVNWNVVEKIDKQKILLILQRKHLPKPKTWSQLLNLWAYVAPEITNYSYLYPVNAQNFCIVPVQGKDVLYAPCEVVRLGEKKLLHSDADWEFLGKYLIVMNQNWSRFIAEQRRAAEQENAPSNAIIDAAYAVLKKIGLEDASDANKVIEQVSAKFFARESISVQDCILLAQIAAKLGAKIGAFFKYITRDGCLHSAQENILFDQDGKLEELLPEEQRKNQLLHPDYIAKLSSCTKEEWINWVSSGRAGLFTFIPMVQKNVRFYGKSQVEQHARKRGLSGNNLSYPYINDQFLIEDWDIENIYWQYWEILAADEERVWTRIAERILMQRPEYWNRVKNARFVQVARNGSTRSMCNEPTLPAWALRLRELPCLLDSRGFPRKPGDLLRRTPETESLMDVELFVHGQADTERTRPLLDLLGVRSTPTGPGRLLDCLRALTMSPSPPAHEIEKWYRRLDQMVYTCSTADFQKIKEVFWTEKLIFTRDGVWVTAQAVFLSSNEEDVPGAPVIRPSVSDLTFWRKISIAERPTADLIIQWLKDLPSGQVLSQEDLRRVRALLPRYPIRIWEECAHWLNLADEWLPVEELAYSLTMQSLIPWGHLHQWVKQKTADLKRLTGEVTSNPLFSRLPLLAKHIEERFDQAPHLAGRPQQKPWLTTIGIELQRVELGNEEETSLVREVAGNLVRTSWLQCSGLEIIPYIDSTPAGTARQADVVWLDGMIYVDDLPNAKLAKRVPEEIGKLFGRAEIKTALDYSFERSPEDVRAYLRENFTIGPVVEEVEDVEESVAPISSAVPDSPLSSAVEQSEDVLHESVVDIQVDPAQPLDGAEAPVGIGDDLLDDDDFAGVGTLVGLEEKNEPAAPPKPKPEPPKPKIIERFATAQKFTKDSNGRFFHEDGSWIGRSDGGGFPWERRSATGEIIRYYWPKDHCLEQGPLQLESHIWGLVEKFPDVYAFILADLDGRAVEVPGAKLLEMRDKGDITLYPATYRLVYKQAD